MLVERPDQSATGDVVAGLGVDGDEWLERIAGRAEVIMQILAANAHVLEQFVLQAAARHPAEQIRLSVEANDVKFRPSPAEASGTVGEQIWHEQVAGAHACTAKSVNLAVDDDAAAF